MATATLRRQVTSIISTQSAAQGGRTLVSSRELVAMREEITHGSQLRADGEQWADPKAVANAIHQVLRHVNEVTQGARSLPVLGGAYFPNQVFAAGVAVSFAHGLQSIVSFISCRMRQSASGPAPVLVEVGQDGNRISVAASAACLCDVWIYPQPGPAQNAKGGLPPFPVPTTATTINTRAYFGDGNDGVGTFDGVATPAGTTRVGSGYTANRDLYYSSATLSGAAQLNMNGWRLFVRDTLTHNGNSLNNDGSSGSSGNPIAGGVGGGRNSIGGSVAGNGGSTVVGGNGNPGANELTNSFGGNGGGGGNGNAHSGGAGGSAANGSSSTLRPGNGPEAILGATQTALPTSVLALSMVQGGAGGGAGGGGDSGIEGSGGGGGGVLGVYCRTLVGSGPLSAVGGNGGPGSGTSAPGGGGGGGVILLVTEDKTGYTGLITVSGGNAGTGGTGSPAAGIAGTVFSIPG